MPAAETTGGLRSAKLLQILFWSGVGLTPLAALLLLIGDGFVLQVAAVLAVLVVLLIGLSIALRRDNDSVRGEVEELLYEEVDTLRDNIRGDITHAARQTHGQLVERINVLHETVDALRNQVDVMRGQMERAAQHPQPPHHTGSASVPQGVLRHTETVQVTTKTMVVDPTDQRRDGTVYGARPQIPQIPQQRRPDRSERERGDWPEQGSAERGARQERGADSSGEWDDERGGRGEWADRADRPERGHGVRGTGDPAVWAARGGHPDREPDRGESRGGHGRGEPGRAERGERSDRTGRGDRSDLGQRSERISRSERTERPGRTDAAGEESWSGRDDASGEESWTERLIHERMARGDADRPESQSRGGGRRRAYDPDDEGNVTGVRTTDRWASVHSDERGGRELRMGERRAAVHNDETGTHVRIEDRWATVRHEEFYAGDDRAEESRREGPRRSAARRERERDWASGEHERAGRHGTADAGTDWAERTARELARDTGRSGGHHAREDGAHWSESSYEEARRDDSGGTRWSEVRRERHGLPGAAAALPAAPAEPASRWTPSLANPARDEERVSRRAGPSDDDEEYGWNGGRDEPRGRATRQIVDFEGNDDRWR
ncbi:hypothetical protein GCM10010399_73660 [Dactylosporangium fulvum]|uniref:Uncharacterized protein n=1 Tax=Dactylosporangium fulvum TaxID=53359 RepID=A0ABY5W1K5_9ACTN|nr:hypothetical protein [Dactylosporangium fulvum]UWP83412.1 hypothetical protein Dfulv_03710 [Dactylosporangium fulvum]